MAKETKKITKVYTQAEYEAGKPQKDAEDIVKNFPTTNPESKETNIQIKYKVISRTPQSIDNPVKDAPYGSTFMLHSKDPNYYIRFGYLLEYVRDNILPRVKTGDDHEKNPPIFDIDADAWDNYMYSLPNQISLDPRVCIVRNSSFINGQGTTKVFSQLQPFREADISGRGLQNSALPLNIYLNFKFVLECLKSDDKGDVNIFEFISSICTGLNKALGGINNLEPIIDETSNTLKIIDTTPIPGRSGGKPIQNYLLQLYGYDKTKNGYRSNFIRKIDLKTAITPEYATMITVGATAGGYVKGTEATAFSKWNVGLTDRFKEDFEPGKLVSVKPKGGQDEAEENYVTQFIAKGYKTRYGFSDLTPGSFTLVDDIISKNTSIVTEYYKYLLSKDRSNSGGTIGFIPFKLSITMDGLSGIKIYNKLEVNTEFLPKAYGKNMNLIVTGVSHKLSNSDWETDLETTVIPKAGALSVIEIPASAIEDSIQTTQRAAFQKATKNPPSDIIQAMKTYGITDPLEKAHFLAQISHESGQFKYREEIWGPTRAQKTYEGRVKGLGNTQPGDGFRYKGRGYMQLTGRANYKKYNEYLKSKGIKDDVLKDPSLVGTKYAADVSAWFWKVAGPSGGVKNFPVRSRQGSSVADVTKITKWVNGGTNGIQDRIQKFNYYWSILQKNPNAFT
jgi:putative chitinase